METLNDAPPGLAPLGLTSFSAEVSTGEFFNDVSSSRDPAETQNCSSTGLSTGSVLEDPSSNRVLELETVENSSSSPQHIADNDLAADHSSL